MQRFGRLRAVVITAALVMTVGAQGTAVALPSPVPLPGRGFASSFEAGEHAPDWQSTVDTGTGGGKRASGVDGGYGGGLPGDVTDRV
ncbi:hypothetical protein, partial [Streptomyces sp. NPDC005486]